MSREFNVELSFYGVVASFKPVNINAAKSGSVKGVVAHCDAKIEKIV